MNASYQSFFDFFNDGRERVEHRDRHQQTAFAKLGNDLPDFIDAPTPEANIGRLKIIKRSDHTGLLLEQQRQGQDENE
jgi:hypothetical protein